MLASGYPDLERGQVLLHLFPDIKSRTRNLSFDIIEFRLFPFMILRRGAIFTFAGNFSLASPAPIRARLAPFQGSSAPIQTTLYSADTEPSVFPA